MPRTNLCKREIPHQRVGALIAGAAFTAELTQNDLGAAIGVTPKTLRARLRNPGDLTLSEYTALCRKLHIPIVDARAAIRY